MMTPEEIAARLKQAAEMEIGTINYLERFAAKGDAAPVLSLIPAEIRRQAEALGAAHRIMTILSRRPDIAAQILYAEVAS